MKLSNKAVNQIARIVAQAVIPTTETPYDDDIFENWKYGNTYFRADAELDGGVSLMVERNGLKRGCTDVVLESATDIIKLLFVTGGYIFVQYIEGGSNYLAQEKAPKSVADVVATLQSLLGEDIEYAIVHAPCATVVRCPNWIQIVGRLCSFPPVDVDVTYEIDGSVRVPKRVRHCTSA